METLDITNTRLNTAVVDFLVKFSTPPIDENHVLIGLVSENDLPEDSNDFCVITPLFQRRSGTTVESWDKENDVVVLKEYVNIDYQIDCYSKSSVAALSRAQTYETVARSSYGVEHFKKYGIDCQYAEDVKNLSGVLDDAHYVPRWTLDIHLGYTKRVQVSQDYFTTLNPQIVNIDTTFQP